VGKIKTKKQRKQPLLDPFNQVGRTHRKLARKRPFMVHSIHKSAHKQTKRETLNPTKRAGVSPPKESPLRLKQDGMRRKKATG